VATYWPLPLSKCFLSATLLLVSVLHLHAGTIITVASCTDAPTVYTASSASCSGPFTDASATAGPLSVSSKAAYTGGSTPLNYVARASASYDADYLLTIHGSSGIGHFAVCLTAEGYDNGYSSASGSGSASFGPISLDVFGDQTESTCSGANVLAFETPTLFHLHLSALAYGDSTLPHAAGGLGTATFRGIMVFGDDPTIPLGGHAYDLAEVPEPSILLPAILAFIVWVLLNSMRKAVPLFIP
jgi:hypothetical protein